MKEDRPLPEGEIGRLRYRGPGLASPMGDAAEANFCDGWFYPGEIARLDEFGFVFLQGRAFEVIMRNGAKIHPAEVEAVLCEHPVAADVAVIGHRSAASEGRWRSHLLWRATKYARASCSRFAERG